MKKIFGYWLPVIVWMIVIFLFSSRQKVAITDSYAVSFLFFKTLHLLEYSFFYILLYRAFRNTSVRNKNAYILSFVILTLFAISDEIHQAFVPTREGRLRDVIIDLIGGGLGWILLTQWLPMAPKRLKNLVKQWQLL